MKIMCLIPNYNGKKFIPKTIMSFKEGMPETDLVIVDDCSTDDPISYLQKLPAKIIYKKNNGGYASAVNEGLRFFLHNNYDCVIIANSDILFDIKKAHEIYDAVILSFTKEKSDVLGFLENTYADKKNKIGVNISGFLFALKRNVIETVGLLDERFYMYGEEQDYFIRTKNLGFNITQSGIMVSHLTESSSKSTYNNSWLAIRNSILLEFKSKNILNIIKKVFALFLLINRLYKPKNIEDPSYKRVTRSGIFFGNLFLLASFLWNVKNYFLGEKYGR